MTVVVREPDVARARPTRARRRAAAPAARLSRWRRALRWLAVPSRAYTSLVLGSAGVLVTGIALIYVPLALIVAGLAGGLLGLVGLGISVRGAK